MKTTLQFDADGFLLSFSTPVEEAEAIETRKASASREVQKARKARRRRVAEYQGIAHLLPE